MKEKVTSKNWHNSRSLIEILLIFMPPLGLYALYKNTSIRSENIKILYGIIGIMMGSLFLMILFMGGE